MYVSNWKLYVDKKYYYSCLIFPDKKNMYLYEDTIKTKLGLKPVEHTFEGLCSFWRAVGKEDHSNIGHILLHDKCCGGGVVAHELSHATYFYMRKILNVQHTFKTDEMFCSILHKLVRQFWSKFYQYRVPALDRN